MGRARIRTIRNTRFAAFIRGCTVKGIVRELRGAGCAVTPHAVYGWLYGRVSPKLAHAAVMLTVSRGELTIEDIVQHRSPG